MKDTKTVATFCGVCEHSCGMRVTARGNEILEIKGMKEHPSSKGYLCPKGLAAGDIMNAPDRLRTPLKKDGAEWKEISWDEAIGLCAEGLGSIKDRYGPEGLFIYHGQSYLKLRLAYFLMKRFLNLYGAVNLASAGSECFISTMLAHFATFGNLPFPDYEHSRCIILWGSNPCACGGIGKSYPQMAELLKNRKNNGAKIIVIDPRRSASAELADIVLKPRPGTDGALALGFVRSILDRQLEDRDYIEKHTAGFDELKAMIAEYPLERVEQITGIGKDRIAEAARLFVETRPGCIKVGSGLEHHTNGVQSIRATNILLAITGNIDVPGGNTFLAMSQLSPAEVDFSQQSSPLGEKEHPMFTGMVHQAQALAALDHMDSDDPYPVRGMMVAGGSPLAVLADAEKVQRVMDKMEFTVVIDQFMTQTARNADLVLPAATFLERDEISINPIMLQQKVVDPDGVWPDARIWLELARAMGYGEHYPWNTLDEIMEHMLEPTGYSLHQVRSAEGGIVIRQEVGKILQEGFYTYTGKIDLFSKSLESTGYDPLPRFDEPAESPVSRPDVAGEFPLVLTTGARYPVFVHSQHRTVESLCKRFPEPVMEIHPDSARECGVQDGDEVIVSSPRGSVRIKAVCTSGILPGVVHLPHGWQEANCNLLTDNSARDPISGFPGLKSSLCKVAKA